MDNTRGLLIFLVVFGHLLELYYWKYDMFLNLYLFIYSFHMPLFVFLSGYFAKNVNFKKVINFLLLYVIFQTIYSYSLVIIGKTEMITTFFRPYFHLWYLLSMMWWYIMAIVVTKIKENGVNTKILFFAIILCSLFSRYMGYEIVKMVKNFIPYFNTYYFSYQRTLTFSMFFFLGFFITKEQLNRVFMKKWLIASAIIINFGILYYLYISSDRITLDFLYRGSYVINDIEAASGSPMLIRTFLGTILTSLLGSYIVLYFASSSTNIFTRWGENPLSIFLFHQYAYIIISIYEPSLPKIEWLITILLLIFSVIICILLSSKWFERKVRAIIYPFATATSLIRRIKQFFSEPK